MRISLIDRSGVLSTQLRRRVEGQLFSLLAQIEPQPKRLSLVIADANREAGAEQWCRLAISSKRAEDVVVTNCDQNAIACISDAICHAAELLRRNREKSDGRAPNSGPRRTCQDRRHHLGISGPIKRTCGTNRAPIVSDSTIGGL